MKKNSYDKNSFNSSLSSNENLFTNQIKTTNINILLNRVRIEKKNDLKKKLYFSSLTFLIIIFFSFLVSLN